MPSRKSIKQHSVKDINAFIEAAETVPKPIKIEKIKREKLTRIQKKEKPERHLVTVPLSSDIMDKIDKERENYGGLEVPRATLLRKIIGDHFKEGIK